MISQYSDPRDIDREFWNDKAKALYWLKKHTSRRAVEWQLMEDGYDVMDGKADYRFSEPIFYTSPQTGNRWLLYISARKDENGDVRLFYRSMLYYFTELYMTIMIAVTTCEENDDGDRRNEVNGVNVYTAHLFQRMADPDRLGVDMTDRIKVMRNFAEFVGTGWSDTRPPRKGEKFEQVMMRLPGSWLRGHVVEVGGRLVTIYRTFYTDRSMTPQQRKDVKSFKKFADGKLAAKLSTDKERSKGTAQSEPDNERKNEGEAIAKNLMKQIIKNNED